MGSNKLTVKQAAGTIATPERVLQSAITTLITTFSSIASRLPRLGRTTTRSPRLSSTSRSTWSSTPAMSTCPWPLTSTVMTKFFLDFPPSSRRALTGTCPRDEADGVPGQERRTCRLPGYCQAKQHGVGHSCDSKGDAHLCDFIEAEFLGEQVEGIKELGDLITKIKRAGDGLGLHIMDKE